MFVKYHSEEEKKSQTLSHYHIKILKHLFVYKKSIKTHC